MITWTVYPATVITSLPILFATQWAPLRNIILFTVSHRDGVGLMNRFIRNEEDQLLRESYESDQLLLIDPVEGEIRSRRRELTNTILNHLQNRPRLTRGDIKWHFIFERFGDFNETDYNAVVQELIDTGVLSPSHGRSRINDDVLLTYIPPREGVLVMITTRRVGHLLSSFPAPVKTI